VGFGGDWFLSFSNTHNRGKQSGQEKDIIERTTAIINFTSLVTPGKEGNKL